MSIFMILLVIGVTLPSVSLLLSLIFGSLEGLMSLLKFDIGHVNFNHDAHHDTGHGAGYMGILTALIPMSPIVWCAQLAVMGCVGEMLNRSGNINIVATWLIAIMSGYTVMLIVNNCVLLPLKRAKNFADTTDDMIGQQAEITETILEGGVGAARIVSKSGATIHAAKSLGDIRIDQGEKVIVLEITNGRAIVKKKEEKI